MQPVLGEPGRARKNRTLHASAEDLEAMAANDESRSDWAAAEAMAQEEVERLADEEEGKLAPDWEDLVFVGLPPRKQAVHIRLDQDVLGWFRALGPGYQTRINAVLRAFVQARREADAVGGNR